MNLLLPGVQTSRLPGAAPAWHADVDVPGWRTACEAVASAGGRLGALWASDEREARGSFAAHALLVAGENLLHLRLDAGAAEPAFPDLSDLFGSAPRMQRAMADLVGVRPTGPADKPMDPRGWLRHGAWRGDVYPLRRDVALERALEPADAPYAFVSVEGDGVHEIPVGPVHAGTIEPGHFRFSIVGERVLRLEQRLGYKHKGIEKRFESMSLEEGARLAGRVSGDSTVAYAWAYAMALEGMAGVALPARALWLRALLLERERVANHLGDLGALGNDGGLAFGLAQFGRLKEDTLRTNARLFGHRYLMDRVVPGGVAADLDAAATGSLLEELDRIEREVRLLREIYDDHAGLQDRFIACGVLAPGVAAYFGVVGFAARASGIAVDARLHPGLAPYPELAPGIACQRAGDVAARVAVRFDETLDSIKMQRRILNHLPSGPVREAVPAPAAGAFGVGWVEGWRGEVFVALESGPHGAIRRCHPHDPSWQIWPALEHAIIGNIVPDFPLINKSFNLSYAGHDL
ncbi:MAG: NADH-quinone oxidoreductase subunit C [Burkholderiales bacterium]